MALFVKKLRGFTLVELLVVLAILATLAGLASVFFVRSFQARSLEHYVKELTAYLRFVQYQAIEDGRTRKLAFEEAGGGFSAFVQEGVSEKFVPAQDRFFRRLASEETFTPRLERGSELYFFPDGALTKNKLMVSKGIEPLATIEIRNRVGSFQVKINE